MSGPLKQYLTLISKGNLRPDAHQLKTVNLLQTLHENISKYTPTTSAPYWWQTPLPNPAPLGLYLHGDVGTGKVDRSFRSNLIDHDDGHVV
jgi:predicted ATPase